MTEGIDSSVETTPVNYFNYFTEIEEAFIRRRGKHLWLSPVDWALMEVWKESGIPLHVALRGVERAFDSFEAKPRYRTVKSLLYCREEVEAQYSEWRDAKVGAGDAETNSRVEDSGLPFPRETVQEHMARALDALNDRAKTFKDDRDLELAELYQRAIERLNALVADVNESGIISGERLEESLTHVEKMLTEAIRAHATHETTAAVGAFADSQLSEFKKRMDKETYQQTRENVFIKRLREEYGLPRLSLFYL